MELSVREWTIIVGVLLILAVFLDGYRRVRNERSNRIRVSLSRQVFQQHSHPDDDPVDTTNPELPNGGARVIAKQRVQDLHLREPVPVLIEPVAIPEAPRAAEPAPQPEIELPAEPAEEESFDVGLFDEPQPEPAPRKKGSRGRVEPQWEEPVSRIATPDTAPLLPVTPAVAPVAARDNAAQDNVVREGAAQETVEAARTSRSKQARQRMVEQSRGDEDDDSEALVAQEPQEVLVVNVLSKDKGGFNGPDLLQILLACDLRFGKMQIFHRYENAHGRGPIQFSLANLVEPGTFDLDSIDTLRTPGVSFFMTLPGPKQSLTAFNYMIETAQVLVRNLNAELRDDAHSVMTAQTIEHCRQRIRDFERRQLTLQL